METTDQTEVGVDWGGLPRDILVLVVSKLPSGKSWKLRGVNRHWCLAVDSAVHQLCVSYRARMMMGNFTRVIELVSGRFVNLRSLQVKGAGIYNLTQNIGNLTGLTSLDLHNTSVGDADMLHLTKLRRLRSLDLSWTRVSDVGVKHLACLRELMKLNLGWTKVSDAGVGDLLRLTNLTSLNVQKTGITEEGAEKLTTLTEMNG